VRVPLNRTADLSRVIRASALLRDKFGREPTPAELSQLTGISEEIVSALAALNAADVRLDAAVGKDSDRALIERFSVEEMPNVEEQVLNRFRQSELSRALATLPPRDARILRLYFGIEGGREHTLDEIGRMLGVTRERVRQLRDRALRRLREGSVGEALRDLSAA
jgi:RNA polymerase primary sigma factor